MSNNHFMKKRKSGGPGNFAGVRHGLIAAHSDYITGA